MNGRVYGQQDGDPRVAVLAVVLVLAGASMSWGEGGLSRVRRWLRRPSPGVQLRNQLPPDVDPADLEPPEVTGVPPIADVMRELAAAQRSEANAAHASEQGDAEGKMQPAHAGLDSRPTVDNNRVLPRAMGSKNGANSPRAEARADATGSGTSKSAATAQSSNEQVVTVEISPLGFHGVQPGKSRVAEVLQSWGPPAGSETKGEWRVDLYALEPFQEVRLAYEQEVVRSIAIVLDGMLGREQIEKHLGLESVEAAPLIDERGQLVAYVYPERGLMLRMSPQGLVAPGGDASLDDADEEQSHSDGEGTNPPGAGRPAPAGSQPGGESTPLLEESADEASGSERAVERLPDALGSEQRVTAVVLEEIDPLAFVRRAEARLPLRADAALVDLETALALDGKCHAAWGAKSELFTLLGRPAEALQAAEEALAGDKMRPEYQLARARALLKLGRHDDALAAVEELLGPQGRLVERAPHLAATAALLAGQCFSLAPRPDFARAAQMHMHAMKLAQRAMDSENLRVRKQAAACLVEGHLAMAYDVAWGRWKDKQASVQRWLSRAVEVADEAAAAGLLDAMWELKLHQSALAALAGLQEAAEPASWVAQVQAAAAHLLEATQDPATEEMVRWELGTALYDAVQIEQLRGELDLALMHGKDAAAAMTAAAAGREPNAPDAFLLGRLYYRLGAIHALAERNHIRATEWYDQAIPWLNRPAAEIPAHLLLPWGEMLVSMAISYWEAGAQTEAIELTLHGAGLMEGAVHQRQAAQDVLSVPYNNLARMYEQAGDAAQAARFRRLANKSATAGTPR